MASFPAFCSLIAAAAVAQPEQSAIPDQQPAAASMPPQSAQSAIPEQQALAPAPPRRGFLFHPDGPALFAWRLGVGALVDVLPRKVVQSEQRQVPQITVQARVGLPVGFSIDARASAILLTNQLELGAAWTAHVGPLALAIQDHQGFWFGFVGVQGFDSSGWGWINKPGLSAGMTKDNIRFSVTGELIYMFGQHVRLGADNIARDAVLFAGTSLTLAVENLLDSGRLWYFGVGLLRTSPHYEAWVAFSDERSRLPYPRFFGGYAF